MSQINFDNASIAPINSQSYITMAAGAASIDYWYIGLYCGGLNTTGTNRLVIKDSNGNPLTSSITGYVSNVTENGFKVFYDGTMNSTGNYFEFWFNNTPLWRISNIQFEANDTFHFQIDVDFNFS